jgi:hypothetical protein
MHIRDCQQSWAYQQSWQRSSIANSTMTTNSAPIDVRIENTIAAFSAIYLGGIPPIITNDSAFLAFICMLTATEALAGYRYGAEERNPGERFNRFVREYFPPEYHAFTQTDSQYLDGRLWCFRCRMVHGFSPAGFALTHHHSEGHLLQVESNTGNPILNAEDVYAAFLSAAQAYFKELRSDSLLQDNFVARLDDRRYGGGIGIGPVPLA